MAIPISHAAQPLLLFDYRGYTNTLHCYTAFTVRQRLFTAFTKYGLCVANDTPLWKESVPFLSPQNRAWVDCWENTSAFFLHVSHLPERRGKSCPCTWSRWRLQCLSLNPWEEKRGESEEDTVLPAQERRDRTETSLACRAEQYCFFSPSLGSGSCTSVWGSAAGKEGPFLPPRLGEGLTPTPATRHGAQVAEAHAGLTPGSGPTHGPFSLPLLLRPQSLSRERLWGAGRGAEAGHGHACLGGRGACTRAPAEVGGPREERPSRVRGRSAPGPLLIARWRLRARRARGTRGQQRRPLKRATAPSPPRACSSRLTPRPPVPAGRRPSPPEPASGFIRGAHRRRALPVAAVGPTALLPGQGGCLAAASSGFFGASLALLLAGVFSYASSPPLPDRLGCLCCTPSLLLLWVLVF